MESNFTILKTFLRIKLTSYFIFFWVASSGKASQIQLDRPKTELAVLKYLHHLIKPM